MDKNSTKTGFLLTQRKLQSGAKSMLDCPRIEVAPRRTGPGPFDFSGTGSIAPGLDYFPRLVIRPNAGMGAIYEVAGHQNGP